MNKTKNITSQHLLHCMWEQAKRFAMHFSESNGSMQT